MTVSTPPCPIHRPTKRKYGNDSPQTYSQYYPSSPSLHVVMPVQQEVSPRVIKKLRPKAINPQSLKAKTVRELFQGQRNLQRGAIDIEMQVDDDVEHCSFCEGPVNTMTMGEEEYMCLACGRTVCGKCGIKQYLSNGDYVACLDCVHQG